MKAVEKNSTSQPRPEGFTRELPEHATLLQLATRRPVKVFQIEHREHGYAMCIAHFEHGSWKHLYQDGDSAHSHHLFFWVLAWNDERSPEDVALSFFANKFILSE